METRGSAQLSRQPWGDGTASYCLSLERLVVTAAAALPAVLRELGLPAHSVALLRLVECILAPAAFLPQPLRAEAEPGVRGARSALLPAARGLALANCTVDRSQHQGAVFADVVHPLLAACPNLGLASIKGADPPFQLPARLMQQTSLAELECNNCQLEALPDGPVLPVELPLCLPALCCCSTCMPASPPRGRGCLWLHWFPSDARCSWLALPHAC